MLLGFVQLISKNKRNSGKLKERISIEGGGSSGGGSHIEGNTWAGAIIG